MGGLRADGEWICKERLRNRRMLMSGGGGGGFVWIYLRPNLLNTETLVSFFQHTTHNYLFFCFRGGVMGLPEPMPP
jgi:hypothetical protein